MGKLEFGKRYSATIPWGMIFKRRYCCKCGKKLSLKFVKIHYDPDEKWGSRAFFTGSVLRFRGRYCPKGTEYYEPVYRCKNCDYLISEYDQKIICQYQEAYQRRVLTQEEIDRVNITLTEEL